MTQRAEMASGGDRLLDESELDVARRLNPGFIFS